MTSRKMMAIAGLSAITALALAGCSSSTDDEPQATGSASGEVVEVPFWHGYTEADGDVLNGLVEEFNNSQSQYHITPTVDTWAVLNDTFLPALSAGDGPVIMAMPPELVPVYASKGAFASLDDWYASDGNPGTLNEAATSISVVDGVNYGVPLSFTPLTMFYNKALFAEAGIDTLPTTWDEWVATAATLTIDENGDGTPEQYGLALQDHVTVGNGVWPTLFKSGGGDIVDDNGNAVIDSPENQATLEYWHDAVANQHISPGGLDGVAADELYGAGKAAMTFGGPWLASISTEQGIDYGIAPVPSGPAGIQQSALAVTMGVTSQASAEQVAGAEAFFTWFFAKDNMITWSLGSGWPPLTTDVTAGDVADNSVVSALTVQAPNGAALLPGVVPSTDILTAMDSLTQQAMAGGDVSTLLEKTQADMESILAK